MSNRIVSITERNVSAACILLLCLCCCRTGYGSEYVVPRKTADLSIDIDLTANRFLLKYRFHRPVISVSFGKHSKRMRGEGLTICPQCEWTFRNTIDHVDGSTMETLEIEVAPQSAATDRVYPFLSSIGNSGIVFYSDYLNLSEVDLNELRIQVHPDSIVAHHEFAPSEPLNSVVLGQSWLDGPRYIFVGDEAMVQRIPGGHLVMDDRMPNWMVSELPRIATSAASWLDEYFGSEHRHSLFIIASYDPDFWDGSWVGEASPNREIFLRFAGKRWLQQDKRMLRELESFVAHELAHLEIGIKQPIAKTEPRWLSEGFAEYLDTIFSARREGAFADEFVLREISRHASRCVSALELHAIGISNRDESPDRNMDRRRYPYDCGILAYFAIDSSSRPDGLGKELRKIWTSLVASKGDQGWKYTKDDLVAALHAKERNDEKNILLELIDGPDGHPWPEIREFFEKRGVMVSYEYNYEWNERARELLLSHFWNQQCEPDRLRFSAIEDYVQIESNEGGHQLCGNPKIDTVQGASIISNMRDAYTSAQQACKVSETVRFGLRGSSEEINVPCWYELPELPPFLVLNWKLAQ